MLMFSLLIIINLQFVCAHVYARACMHVYMRVYVYAYMVVCYTKPFGELE